MSVIEGIGDEVLQFFSTVSVVVLMVVAWWSTSNRETENNNSIAQVIAERMSRCRRSGEIGHRGVSLIHSDIDHQGVSGDTEPGASTEDFQETGDSDSLAACTNEEVAVIPIEERGQISSEGCSVTTELQTMFSPEHSLRKMTGFPTIESKVSASPSSDTTREDRQEQTMRDGGEIRIRLKYLNGSEKLVQARLHEQLGEFKRRVFSEELLAEQRVRLIFDGKTLESNELTLQEYGLSDGNSVHCLVHSWRAPPDPNPPPSPHQPSDWNFGALLNFILSLIYCLLWYCF